MGQHGHHDSRGAAPLQLSRDLMRGAAGREHIVDHEDGAACEHRAVSNLERPPNILMSHRRGQRGLKWSCSNAAEGSRKAREAQPSCQRLGQHLGLIEAARPLTPPMQRHGDDDIGLQLAQPGFRIPGPDRSKGLGQPLPSRLLHLQDHVAQPATVRAQANRPLEGQRPIAAPATALVEVQVRTDIAAAARTRLKWIMQQRLLAGRAKIISLGRQRQPTRQTRARHEQVPNRAPNRNARHGPSSHRLLKNNRRLDPGSEYSGSSQTNAHFTHFREDSPAPIVYPVSHHRGEA